MTEQRVIDIIIVGGAVIGASVHFLRATRTTVKGGTFVLLRQGCYCDVRSIVNSCSACLISLVKKFIDAVNRQKLMTCSASPRTNRFYSQIIVTGNTWKLEDPIVVIVRHSNSFWSSASLASPKFKPRFFALEE